MSDPFGGLRGGGFGGFGDLTPFGQTGADLGRYNIGDLGSQTAALDKYAAETAWNNGAISNDAYLAALRRYVGTTAAGSRERIAAQNELEDATYTIGRNEIVRTIETGTSSRARIAGWNKLAAYDRRRLRSMVPNNEQRDELEGRIAEAEGAIRAETWGDLVRRYNRHQISVGQMLGNARRMASRSRGARDHEDWLDAIVEWTDRSDQEQQNDLMQQWNNEKIDGSAVLRFMDSRLAKMNPNSPDYAALQRQRQDMAQSIRVRTNRIKDADIEDRYAHFNLSDQAYLDYWQKRLNDSPSGSEERAGLRRKLQGATFDVSERRASDRFERTGNPDQLIDLYSGALATADPGSSLARALELRIARLRTEAWGTLGDPGPSFGGGSGGTGQYPSLGHLLTPGGTPANAEGFASQFDGSPFASSNCVYASTAMLAWAAGVTGLSGGDMRFYSDDTDDDGIMGGRMEDAAAALSAVGVNARQEHGLGLSAFRRRLMQGQGAVVWGAYGNVSGRYRLDDFSGSHGIYVDRAKVGKDGRTYYYVMDPLGRQGYNGDWWPEEMMARFAWSNAPTQSGGTWFGDVMFASRGNKVVTHKGRPPQQSFDTDANGRSTVGRGGGRSREEAGYRPPNFGQNRRKPKPRSGDGSVSDFLGAVTRVGQSDGEPLADMTPEERKALRVRARELLSKYDGDPRMAAIEWFTGQPAPTNVADWTTGQKFYADAVGGQYGMGATGSAGEVEPGSPATPQVGTEPSAGTQQEGTRSGTVQDKGGAPSPYDKVAGALLERLGAPNTPDMRRAIISVLAANAGGNPAALPATNPFLITTPGQSDPSLVFDSFEEGIDAAADEILDRYPQIAGAARSGDPRRLLDSWGKSDWNPTTINTTTLIKGFNDQPGDTKLYGGERYLDTPQSLVDAARKTPDLENLINIDPSQADQRAWWDKNWDNIRQAADAGYDHWTFITPDGRNVTVPFTPGLEIEMGRVGYEHTKLDVEIARASGDQGAIDAAETRQRAAISEMGDITIETGRDIWEQMGDQANGALERGEPGLAFAIYQSRRNFIASEVLRSFAPMQGAEGAIPVMGGMQVRPSADITRATNPFLDANDRATIGGLLDADQGNELLDLMEPDAQGRTGFTQDGQLNPAVGFLTQYPDKEGNWAIHVVTSKRQPDLFADTTLVDPNTGVENRVPLYVTPNAGKVPVRLGNGAIVYQDRLVDDGAGADVYLRRPSSLDKAVQQQTPMGPMTVAGGGLGLPPIEQPAQRTPPPSEWTYVQRSIQGLDVVRTFDPVSRSVVEWFSIPGSEQWFGAPQGKRPTLVLRNEALNLVTFQDNDGTKEPMFNNKPVAAQRELWAQLFGFYGTEGTTRVNNEPGLGARGQTWVVRDADPASGTFDGSLSDMDRFHMGGNFWTRGRAIPSSFVLDSAIDPGRRLAYEDYLRQQSDDAIARQDAARHAGAGVAPTAPTVGAPVLSPWDTGLSAIPQREVPGGLHVSPTTPDYLRPDDDQPSGAHGVADRPTTSHSMFESIAAGVRAQSDAARTQAAAATVLANSQAARQAALAARLRAEAAARARADAAARQARSIPVVGPAPSPTSPAPTQPRWEDTYRHNAGQGGRKSKRGPSRPTPTGPAPSNPAPYTPPDTGYRGPRPS